MSQLLAQISISLDGFVAGPNQGKEHPLGEGGEGLHEWVVPTESWRSHHGMEGGEKGPDDDVAAEWGRGVGAHIMGRNMFSPGRGEWDESWRGWWGEDPPFHAPVFVLTHHPREPLPMEGGTTFHFVTDGIEAALEQARAAAGDQNVYIAGGARAIQQYLAAGLLDELQLHIVPIILGGGERLLENVGKPTLEPIDVVASPAATPRRQPSASPRLPATMTTTGARRTLTTRGTRTTTISALTLNMPPMTVPRGFAVGADL